MKLTFSQVFLLLAFCIRLAVSQQGATLNPPYTCTTTVCQPGLPNPVQGNVPLNQGKPGKRGGPGQKGEKGDPCQCDVLDEKVVRTLRDESAAMKRHTKLMENRLGELEGILNNPPENCSAYMNARTGETSYDIVPIYPLKFIGDLSPFMTDCKSVIANNKDGWIPIQRRKDGGTDFYRNWDSYVAGFGDKEGEFWIGLKRLHSMTTKRTCKLRVDFKDWDKTTKYAEYSTFQVAGESSLFRLRVGGYSGNIQDSMAHHNGRKFSTYDRDNDDHGSVHCAVNYKGAWWHGRCHDSNLNGLYYKTKPTQNNGIWWDGFSNSLPYVEMSLLCK